MWVKFVLALLVVISTEAKVLKREAQEYYEPVWNGRGCKDPVDVGRGPGSCNTDCDCPLCSPFCSTSGYCQNHKFSGRRKIPVDLCPQKTESVQEPDVYRPRPKENRKETEAGKFYEPVWNGLECKVPVNVGRGLGSCNTDCDCPLCAPFCSTAGYCQNNERTGRRKISLDLCPQKTQPTQPAQPPRVEQGTRNTDVKKQTNLVADVIGLKEAFEEYE